MYLEETIDEDPTPEPTDAIDTISFKDILAAFQYELKSLEKFGILRFRYTYTQIKIYMARLSKDPVYAEIAERHHAAIELWDNLYRLTAGKSQKEILVFEKQFKDALKGCQEFLFELTARIPSLR